MRNTTTPKSRAGGSGARAVGLVGRGVMTLKLTTTVCLRLTARLESTPAALKALKFPILLQVGAVTPHPPPLGSARSQSCLAASGGGGAPPPPPAQKNRERRIGGGRRP